MVAPQPGGERSETKEYKEERSKYFSSRFSHTYQFIYGREVPDWFSWDLTRINEFWEDYRKKVALLKMPGHKPLLLLLGEIDEPRGHEQVREYFKQWAEPKKLVFLPRSNHYLNPS